MSAYCLNFGGRVTQASVKNFQLVSVDNMVRPAGVGCGVGCGYVWGVRGAHRRRCPPGQTVCGWEEGGAGQRG